MRPTIMGVNRGGKIHKGIASIGDGDLLDIGVLDHVTGREALEAVLEFVAECSDERYSIKIKRGVTEPSTMDHVPRIRQDIPERLTGLRGDMLEEDCAKPVPAHLHLEAAGVSWNRMRDFESVVPAAVPHLALNALVLRV
jgi:hypothetical protein